jgi:hypothetical protein
MKSKTYSFAKQPGRKVSIFEVECLEDRVSTLEACLGHSDRLRKVENLSADNFEHFLVENEPLVEFTPGGESFFPCTSSISDSNTEVGKFARQMG